MTPEEWVLSRDTGISSKTIWAAMNGAKFDMADIPADPEDFGRCYRLLNHFSEWKKRLNEVALKFPKWGPLIEAWDVLTALYEEEYKSGMAPKLYSMMQELYEPCMIAGGWVKTGRSSWSKGSQFQGTIQAN